MAIEIHDERALRLLNPDAPIEQVATGFIFTEGAAWHGRDQYLVFSDIIGNQMYRWDARSGVETFRDPSNMANGNTWDHAGRLLTCEHASSRVTRLEPNGSLTILASHYNDRELNSPNDIVVKRDGAIYFTDPIFGRRIPHGIARDPALDHCSVYRIDQHSGNLQRLNIEVEQPNGLCFSLDEHLLYVNDSPNKRIHVYEMQSDGTVGRGRVFATMLGDELGVPDGMKVDVEGNVYCCGPGGIHVYAATGTRLARIRFPEKACNFAFGDADHQTLFVTASTSVYRIRTLIAGRPQWTVAQTG